MSEETIYESIHARNRHSIARYLRRMADAFDGSGAVPVGDSTAVNPPEDAELAVEVEQEGDEVELDLEVEWDASDGTVETDAAGAESAEGDAEAVIVGDDETASDDVATRDAESSVDVDAVKSDATFELYRDRADEWRWRLRHANGNVIADSGEGYSRKANAQKGIRSVRTNAAGADLEEVE